MKKLGPIAKVYNDGVISIFEKTQVKDKFHTPIRGQYAKELVYEDWFRDLGITNEDMYYANATDTTLVRKVAIKGKVQINIKHLAIVDNEEFEIYRTYYSYKNNETEISLAEVRK